METDRGNEDPLQIPRGETGIRVLFTILFWVVAEVLKTVVNVMVIFELLWTLVTQRAPKLAVRDLANRVIAYHYRIQRYLTYNDATRPFPFSPLPDPLEPTGSPHDEGVGRTGDLSRPGEVL